MPATRTQRAFRGRDRGAVAALKKALKRVSDMDLRRAAKAQDEGVPPVLFNMFAGEDLNPHGAALEDRTVSALAQTVSFQSIPTS